MERPHRVALQLVLAAGWALAAAAAPAEPLRVMPLGDSLTKGIGSSHGAGYRLTFLKRMKEAGVDVDMVGKFHDGPEGMDGDHQGYPGRGVAKLDQITFEAIREDRPNVVILWVGTNDAKGSLVPEAFRIRYSVLLDRSLAESTTKLIAATVPPHRGGTGAAIREQVNKIIREEVAKRAAQGKAIHLVDVYKLLDDQKDFADALHMNDAGYEKVGNAFADALLEMLHSTPPGQASAGP